MKWGVSAAVREWCSDLKPQECCAAALLPRSLGWGAAAAAVVQLHPAVGKCVYEWADPHEATSEEAEVLHSPQPLSQERISHPAECSNVLLTAKFYGKPHRKAGARLRSQEIHKPIVPGLNSLIKYFLGFLYTILSTIFLAEQWIQLKTRSSLHLDSGRWFLQVDRNVCTDSRDIGSGSTSPRL